MSEVATSPEVDVYIARSDQWPDVMAELRPVVLQSGLTEEIKWGKPCYTHEGGNVVIFQEMKGFLALMFFKGALLADPDPGREVRPGDPRRQGLPRPLSRRQPVGEVRASSSATRRLGAVRR